ncbi:MAG: hypothetical protein KC496_01915, partial [Anaerolineae bacterium]|nr:hypothetical protein [Anaerolineae bacterium]
PVGYQAISPDFTYFAYSSSSLLHLLDITSCNTNDEVELSIGAQIFSVAFSPDSQSLITGAFDHSVRLWDVETGLPMGSPRVGHTESVYSVVFSPDGTFVASGSTNEVLFWKYVGLEQMIDFMCDERYAEPLTAAQLASYGLSANHRCAGGRGIAVIASVEGDFRVVEPEAAPTAVPT